MAVDEGYKLPQWLKPIIFMLAAQAITVAINIFYKLAVIDSMPTSILIAYRFIFGIIPLAPLTIYKSRITRVKPTWKLASLTFVYGLLGGSLYHNLYLSSLTFTSATFVSAIVNLTPVITYILTMILGLETLAYWTSAGKAKVVGIMLSIGAVMLLALYKHIEIDIWPTKFNILPQENNHKTQEHNNQILGLVLAMIAALSSAGFLTIQAKYKEECPNIFLIPFLINLMAAIQAVVYALCVERDWAQWKIGLNIRFWAASFAGVFGSGLITTMNTWCISLMGPLFVSTFNPVGLILMTLVGSLVLDEKLYLTSLAAILLIIVATLLVLLGKLKEGNSIADQSEESVSVVNETEVAASDIISQEICLIEIPTKFDPECDADMNKE